MNVSMEHWWNGNDKENLKCTWTFWSWNQASTLRRQQQTASDMMQLPMCLTLQCHWHLKSSYSPGQRSFTFIVPLNVFLTTQCAETNTEGLMFSVTRGRKWMPWVDYFFFFNICKGFPLLLSRHLSPLNQFSERHSFIFWMKLVIGVHMYRKYISELFLKPTSIFIGWTLCSCNLLYQCQTLHYTITVWKKLVILQHMFTLLLKTPHHRYKDLSAF